MTITRRGFLSSCLALASAPAVVRADSLMRVVPTRTVILPFAEALEPFAPCVMPMSEAELFRTIAQIRDELISLGLWHHGT